MSPPTKTSMMLVSGEYFDYLDPDPKVITTLDVLRHGLDVPRFNNQTIRPITVLEHSMRVRRIAAELDAADPGDPDEIERRAKNNWDAERLGPVVQLLNSWESLPEPVRENWRRKARHQASPHVELEALLHDAPEALVPWGDCLRTGKTDVMRTHEGHVLVAIYDALGIPHASAMSAVVTIADEIALYFEAMLWGVGALDWAPEILGWSSCGMLRSCGGREFDLERFLPLIAPRPGEC